MRSLLFILIAFLSLFSYSQERKIEIGFVPYLSGRPLKIDSLYILGDDSLTITACRFYVSGISLGNDTGRSYFTEEAILVDADSNRAIAIVLFRETEGVKMLEFNLGTDSIINVSGAMPGDLDPMHGMYWTWHSGYINLKLEGRSSASSDRKKEFEFHLGGYSAPFSSMQRISLAVPDKPEIVVILDLDAFFRNADLQKMHHIMRPCPEAVSLSRLLAANFRLL